MELSIVLLIVVLAATVVLRKTWRLFYEDGKSGCGSGCGSCPSNGTAGERPIVTLDLTPKRPPGNGG